MSNEEKEGAAAGGDEEEETLPQGPAVPPLFSPEVAEMFDKARAHLDRKRDKEEEVARLSRDITWEAKRVIYTLHRFSTNEKTCVEAKRRIRVLLTADKYFVGLGRALEGEDPFLHYKRYTSSVQEYVEAVVFLHFLESRRLPTYEEVADPLGKVGVPLSRGDYVLGICDFTGELMKAAIPTLTKPKLHVFLAQAFTLVREVYSSFFGIYTVSRELRKKLGVMRASVMKVEGTVYRLKMKVLLYKRIPDTTELKRLELSAQANFSNEGNTADNYGNGRRYNRGYNSNNGNEEFIHDSGID